MKSIWTILSVIAVANVLALAGFVGWLKSTDRLSAARLTQVREVFTRSIAQVKSEQDAASAKVEADKKKQDEEAKAARPPLTASEQLAARLDATEQDRQKINALHNEVESLKRSLRDAQETLKTERAELEKRRKEFEIMIAGQKDLVGSQQFQKTLGVLTSLKPSAAQSVLMQIMNGQQPKTPGAAATMPGKSQVVAYLDAMNKESRSQIMAEFAKSNPALAAELLEMLRTYGQVARAPGIPMQ